MINFSRNISKNLSEHFKKSLGTFQKISRNILKNLSEHLKKSLGRIFYFFRSFLKYCLTAN